MMILIIINVENSFIFLWKLWYKILKEEERKKKKERKKEENDTYIQQGYIKLKNKNKIKIIISINCYD